MCTREPLNEVRTLESLEEVDGVVDVDMYAENVRVDREDHNESVAELVITCDGAIDVPMILLQKGELLLCYGTMYYYVATEAPQVNQIHGYVRYTYTLKFFSFGNAP